MKKQPIQSATSLPPSPDAERKVRMLKYTIAMVLRLICFVVAVVRPVSWWTIIPLMGAIVLPYIAVVLANTVIQSNTTPVERPGSLVPVSLPHHPGANQ